MRAVDMIRQKMKRCNPYKNKNRVWILRGFSLFDTDQNIVKSSRGNLWITYQAWVKTFSFFQWIILADSNASS